MLGLAVVVAERMEFWLLQVVVGVAEELPRDGLEILGLLAIIIPQGNLPMPVMESVSADLVARGSREVAEGLISVVVEEEEQIILERSTVMAVGQLMEAEVEAGVGQLQLLILEGLAGPEEESTVLLTVVWLPG
jgi:hypothetical protein